MIINKLKQPVGSLSKELAVYDPVDKPILCYEHLLYFVSMGGTALAKVMALLDVSAYHWLRIAVLSLIILTLFLALFNLLVPPRLSGSRLAIVIINTIWLLVLKT